MEHKKIVLVVDNPTRDLFGIILLGIYLAKKGFECYLLPMNIIYENNGEEIWRIAPNYILINYMRVNNQKIIQKIVDSKIPVGVLDTEGGVLVNLESYKQTFMTDINLARKITNYFSWGRLLGEYLVNEKLLLVNQLKVTGSPRFDFYAKPLSEITISDTKKYFLNENPIILINSNFPIANPQFQSQEGERGMLINVFKMDVAEVDNMIKNQRGALEEFIAVTLKLAKHYPTINFLYRPHPFENEKVYVNHFANISNILITKDGPVLNQIAKSICIIHRSCSTAIESQLVGKPAFSLKWAPCFKEQPLSETVSIGCENFESLLNNLDSLLESKFILPQKIHEDLITIGKDWFSGFDGKAHLRVGNEIINVIAEQAQINNSKELEKNYNQSVHHTGLERIRGIIYIILNIQSNWSIKKYFKRIPQEKDPFYALTIKERILWFFIYLFNINKGRDFLGTNSRERIKKSLWKKSSKYFDYSEVSDICKRISVLYDGEYDDINVREAGDYSIGFGKGDAIILEQIKS